MVYSFDPMKKNQYVLPAASVHRFINTADEMRFAMAAVGTAVLLVLDNDATRQTLTSAPSV